MTYVNGSSCIAISILFIVLGCIAVAARFYVRLISTKAHIGVDDWLCLPALLLLTGCAADLIIGATRHAVGYHVNLGATGAAAKMANEEAEKNTFEAFYIFIVLQTAALGCVKLSILFFYRRVFVGHVFKVLNWTMITIVLGWTVAFLFANIFPCSTHFAMFWGSPSEVDQYCVKTLDLAAAFAISDVTVDFVILVLPLYWIWGLQMPLNQKVSVSLIFMLGALTVAAALCRCIIFCEAVFRPYLSPGTVLGTNSKDVVGVVSAGLFWAMIEMGTAMIVCCLPSLRPLFLRNFPRSLLGSMRSKLSLHSLRSRSSPIRSPLDL